ncbi:hypothetical protein DEA8626_03856 [Defluviimonas aquaemixtae]|uniref:Lipoprotein n=1 Tax=Albidovulum aquaemixtae TaxID=1542388 RepID=A0A2R8BNB9_9RHOB|nr:hypothetical protein [Defluviimonas aquaemixtae]SPH24823.1 hypothetical protein DEA8626_03856 [Defluviimonas aquaemixtae]
MKLPIAILLAAAMTLPGCAGVVAADATRKETRALIAKVMAAERPGVDAEAAAVCVQKAMSVVETGTMGLGDTSVVSAANRDRILEYAQRPDAVACLDALAATEAAG